MAHAKFKVILSDVANEEMDEAFCWYQSKGGDLGWDFMSELEFFLLKLADNPLAYSYLTDTYREGLIDRFPYQVVFMIVDETVNVLHVVHAHRDPNRKF